MPRPIVILIGALLLYAAACDESEPTREYFEYSYIDTVLVGDTIRNDRPVPIVHVYPAGCNYFDHFEVRERGDTLTLAAAYRFYFSRVPCAHGSGLDTTNYYVHWRVGGAHYLYYRRNDTTRVLQPVFVEE